MDNLGDKELSSSQLLIDAVNAANLLFRDEELKESTGGSFSSVKYLEDLGEATTKRFDSCISLKDVL